MIMISNKLLLSLWRKALYMEKIYEYNKSFRNGWYLRYTDGKDYKSFPTDISLKIYAEENNITLSTKILQR